MSISEVYTNKLTNILQGNITENEKIEIIENNKIIYSNAIEYIKKSNNYQGIKEFEYRILACELFNKIVNCIDIREFLLINSNPKVSREIYINSLMNLGNYLKTIVENLVNEKIRLLHQNNATRTTQIDLSLTPLEQSIFNKALSSFIGILQIDFEHSDAIKQITSVYSQLTYLSQSNYEICLRYLNESLVYDTTNPSIHYNLGHIYQRLNKLESSLIHYKLAIELTKQHLIPKENISNDEKRQNEFYKLMINCYNGIGSIYRNIKKWPESLHYILKAYTLLPDDPDINNQLGVVYTEMRRTDLGENHYKLAIENYTKTFISTDSKFLLAELYLNMGHLYSYNGDNNKAIDSYNSSLKVVPKFSLSFCNKLMNLCYIFDQLPDDNKMYITNQHKQINKLYAKNPKPYTFDKNYFNTPKINIGIVSGDFSNHPVSYFISTFLKSFDDSMFNVTCYSECVIDNTLFNKNITCKIIKHMSQENASQLIYNDHIHILLDLTGHTAFNRMDIFSFKPTPIQITYIGYPFTSGLTEIDYRITDYICDNLEISQSFYTEKLIALENCFLCYDYNGISRNQIELPKITETPRLNNSNELIIGCFNRVNKITDTVIEEFNKIMLAHKNVKFMFKTKALINLKIRKEFILKFDKTVQDRVIILDCQLTHEQHIETYNQIDIAIDTFPYSGTTTTCEALSMGVPVFSLYDTKYYFHAQNVSVSILKNSGLDFYVCNKTEEIIDKIQNLLDKPIEFWKTQKEDTRDKFLNGLVCNKEIYMKNIQNLFKNLYNKHFIN